MSKLIAQKETYTNLYWSSLLSCKDNSKKFVKGHNCVLPLPRKFRYGTSNGLGNIRGTKLRLRLKVACHSAQVVLTDRVTRAERERGGASSACSAINSSDGGMPTAPLSIW
ncbi:hypothetical protein C0J52_23799 [Blattella germanica]|nr:hypothetical protein C0J52_23799 [Blattella germanica]